MTISRWILLSMRDVLDESCRENQNTHFMFNFLFIYLFFFVEHAAVYGIMSKSVVEPEGPRMTSPCGACALHVGYARLHARMNTPTRPGTHTHLHAHEHARTHTQICNTYCFSTAKIIRVRASVLRYTYIACLVCYHFKQVDCWFTRPTDHVGCTKFHAGLETYYRRRAVTEFSARPVLMTSGCY